MHLSTIPALLAPGTTGRHWRMSPLNTKTLLPNGSGQPIKSCRLWCMAANCLLSSMVASSTTSNQTILTSFANSLWAGIFSMLSSSGLSGAFILEWKVLPFASRIAAMPVVAMARATQPPPSRLRTFFRMLLRMKVLPQPPLALIYSLRGALLVTALMTAS